MRVKHITFTGADDRIDPAELRLTSKRYPQVEWGILFSKSQANRTKGASRFPSHDWVKNARFEFHGTPANFSIHLCGQYVRDILNGEFTLLRDRQEDLRLFKRLQLNFHGDQIHSSLERFEEILRTYHSEFDLIFQMDGVNEPVFHRLRERAIKILPLFDQSHGEGTVAKTLEKPLDMLCGYAGGLGPDNLAEQLGRLEEHVGDREVWVDMETKIRNDKDEFDLEKVRECLSIAEIYF